MSANIEDCHPGTNTKVYRQINKETEKKPQAQHARVGETHKQLDRL